MKLREDFVRILFVIDDLDRCLPDTTLAMFESIKNHLSVNRAAYLLAINPQVVCCGIEAKYGAAGIAGREYLERIVDHAFLVPKSKTTKLVSFALGELKKALEVSHRRDDAGQRCRLDDQHNQQGPQPRFPQ